MEDILLQLRHTRAQILRIFHLGPLSGFGRKWLHPKYIRARNRGPSLFHQPRKSEPTPNVSAACRELGIFRLFCRWKD